MSKLIRTFICLLCREEKQESMIDDFHVCENCVREYSE